MSEKRQIATRAMGERAAKKAKPIESLPKRDMPLRSQVRASKVRSTPRMAVEKSENPLPHKVQERRSHPTMKEQESVRDRRRRSISDSGVLAASVQRSRNKWLIDGVLERYWTKPVKRKGQPESLNNPPRESMQKLGLCKIIIEPHVFEATLYTIRECQASVAAADNPSLNPRIQYNHSPQNAFGMMSTWGNPKTSVIKQPLQPQVQNHSMSNSPLLANSQRASAPTTPTSLLSQQPHPQTVIDSSLPNATSISQSSTKPGQDPVIQMLAQRASTNQDLKLLMKVVACGSASNQQLKIFQGHIDEFTAILQQQRQRETASIALRQPSLSAHSSSGAQSNNSYIPINPFGINSISPNATYSLGAQPHTPQIHNSSTNGVIQPKTCMVPKSDKVIGLAIEFTAGCGDRFLFPKYSILEHLPGYRQVICLFLVTRKGDLNNGGTYDANKSYHELVTIRLLTEHPRVIETLSKVVAPYQETRQHMEQVMASTTRSNQVNLGINLPTSTADMENITAHATSLSNITQEGGSSSKAPPARLTPESASDIKTGRGSKNKQDEWDQHCRYCYAAVSASEAKSNAPIVCHACNALRKKMPINLNGTLGHTSQLFSFPAPQRCGPKALMLETY